VVLDRISAAIHRRACRRRSVTRHTSHSE
jgi:hypothetical protein